MPKKCDRCRKVLYSHDELCVNCRWSGVVMPKKCDRCRKVLYSHDELCVNCRWCLGFVNKYITVNGKREKIVEVGDYEPSDRTVSIFHGALFVRTKTGWHEAVTNGKVYNINDREVGKHSLRLEP